MATTAAELVVRMGANVSQLTKGIRRAQQRIERFSRRMQGVGRALSTRVSAPLALLGGVALKTAADFEKMEKALEAVMGSSDAARRELEKLRKIAEAPGIGFEQAVNASVRLQVVGQSAAEARDLIAQMGNAIAASGGTAEDLDEVIRQLSQILSLGKLTQENLGQITERAPGVSAALQKAFGTQVAEQINEQVSSVDEFVDRLRAALAEAPRVEGGLANAFANLQISIRTALGDIGKELAETFDIQGLVERVTNAISTIVERFKGLSRETKRAIFTVAGLIGAGGPLIAALATAGIALSALLTSTGLVVAGVLGLGAVITAVALDWEDAVSRMKQVFADFVVDVSLKVGMIAKVLANLYKPVQPAIASLFDTAAFSAGQVAAEAATLFNSLEGEIEGSQTALDKLIAKFKLAVVGARQLFSDLTGAPPEPDTDEPTSPGSAAPAPGVGRGAARTGLSIAALRLGSRASDIADLAGRVADAGRITRGVGAPVTGTLVGLEGLERKGARAAARLREIEERSRTAFSVGQEGAYLFGDVVGSLVSNFTIFGDEIITVKERLKNFGRDLLGIFNRLASRIAAAVAQAAALKAVGSIFNLTAGPFGMGFGKLFGSLAIPGFATGGLAYGPMLAAVGEGPGISRHNPEMIAPANQMMGYIEQAVRRAGGGAAQRLHVTGELRARGKEMQATLSATKRYHNRTGRA